MFFLSLASTSHVAQAVDTSDPGGVWYLVDNSLQLELTIQSDGVGGWAGFMQADGQVDPVDQIEWQPATRTLEFRRAETGAWRWYRGRIVEGVFVGRATLPSGSPGSPTMQTFTQHVTGWNSDYLDADIVPRVFDVTLGDGFLARLRIDRSVANPSAYVGHMKVYATVGSGSAGEELQYDIDVAVWDGTQLQFTRQADGFWQSFAGIVQGRRIAGTFWQSGTPQAWPWFGERAEVLSHGLTRRSDTGLAQWQERTRRQLAHLTMAGAPQPLSTTVNILQKNLPPRPSTLMFPRRDDDPDQWPQDYSLTELEFLHTLANPYDQGTLTRRGHGYLAVPNADAGRRTAVLALNGHNGGAWKMMDPDDPYFWYGDSFARRGYVVLALDVSHRTYGDDPAGGNGSHPAIAAPGFDSDWEEDGERVWTAMRAIDYLLARPDVDPSQLIVVGLSMGGEVASLLAAMDTRVTLVVSSGYSPDFGVMAWNDNHPCWQWNHGDIREYVEMSDYHALIAPRALVVQNGQIDFGFSLRQPPFSAAKQVVRRASAPYAAQLSRLRHHLHDDGHVFRVGGVAVDGAPAQGVVVPMVEAPAMPWDTNWQIDGQTQNLGRDLYGLIDSLIDTVFADSFENAP